MNKNIGATKEATPTLTELISKAKDGKVKDALIDDGVVDGHYADGSPFRAIIPSNYPGLYDTLNDHGVNITIKNQNSSYWVSMLINIAPFALLLGLWFFLLRQMQSGGNKAMSFGKSARPPALHAVQKKITFKGRRGRR